MTHFWQQLIARQQGKAETVQPLMASRFEPSTQLNSTQPNTEEPFSPISSPWQEGPYPTPTPPLANMSSPPAAAAAPSPSSAFMPSLPTNNELSRERSLAEPPATRTAISTRETITRLETITHWRPQSISTDPTHSPNTNPITHAASLHPQTEASSPQQSASPDPTAQQASNIPNTPLKNNLSPLSKETPNLPLPSFPHIPIPPSPTPTVPHPHALSPLLTAPPLPTPHSPTIQVAIGRIEIRGTPPTAPPTPPARQTRHRPKPAVSLDTYLQQRSRRT